MNASTREALESRLRFYRDLGLTEFYRRPVDEATAAQWAALAGAPEAAAEPEDRWMPPSYNPAATPTPARPATHAETPQTQPSPSPASPFGLSPFAPVAMPVTAQPPLQSYDQENPLAPRKPIPTPPEVAAIVAPAQRAAALQQIRDEIGDCKRCPLHAERNQLVFGDGDANARLFFVGEGPGADEDAQGLPFVGKAGQLLNNMIAAMGLRRDQVYIANVVKCRPPANRVPELDEGAQCTPFLFKQIDVVRPEVVVALGATAATWLLGARQPLAGLRGRIHGFRGTKLIVTYHPAFLLRDPRQKKEAWADLQLAMRELGLKPPTKG
jgi:DNA polymerase